MNFLTTVSYIGSSHIEVETPDEIKRYFYDSTVSIREIPNGIQKGDRIEVFLSEKFGQKILTLSPKEESYKEIRSRKEFTYGCEGNETATVRRYKRDVTEGEPGPWRTVLPKENPSGRNTGAFPDCWIYGRRRGTLGDSGLFREFEEGEDPVGDAGLHF